VYDTSHTLIITPLVMLMALLYSSRGSQRGNRGGRTGAEPAPLHPAA
jgi:hypothetical protein